MTHAEAKVQAILEAISRTQDSLERFQRSLQKLLKDLYKEEIRTIRTNAGTYKLVLVGSEVHLEEVK